MLDALAVAIRDYVKQEFQQYIQIEGNPHTGWLVADLDDVVIHFFSPDQRNYYRLEQLWDKGKRLVSLQ